MKRFLLIPLAVFLLIFVVAPSNAYAQTGWAKTYDNAVVVSADQLASQVGIEIIKQGGNAIDAAVAVQFALAVTLPRAGNIGGGGFMTVYLNDGTVTTLDYREVAPRRADRNMYIRNGEYVPQLSQQGALAVGVPGTVDGMIKALERYGRLPLEVVITPAIELARSGYTLNYTQARDLNVHARLFKNYESSTLYFTKGDTARYREGELFVQEDLARTLELISQFGREGFYAGETAREIVDEMQKNGGIISLRDLRDYSSKWRNPVKTTYEGYDLYLMPPPSSGSIAISQILSMMNPYDLKAMGHNSSEYIHLLTESMRRAFADRSHYLGDPDFWTIPQTQLLSQAYNEARMETFSPTFATASASLSYGELASFQESSETTHYSIIDNEGNAVAVTTTLNGSFGSHLAVGNAGFLLNNEMDDFSAQPGKPNAYGLVGGDANAIEPGKRMLSSMTPTIVAKNGKVRMVLGAAGGPRIITTTLQSFLNIAVFEMNAQQALAAQRVHHQWLPDNLYFEPYSLSKDTERLLKAKGHNLVQTGGVGRAHIIYVDENGRIQGGYDPRGQGFVSGF